MRTREKPLFIVGHCRVSTDKQADEGQSLAMQEDAIREYGRKSEVQVFAVTNDEASGAALLARIPATPTTR